MEKIVFESEFDVCEVLNQNDTAIMIRTVVDEFEFPEYIVKRLDTGEERVFTHNGLEDALSEFEQAEKYYNYLTLDLYYDRSHSISKW
jgi:hypothetical protein|tara:strand:- start:1202 stop:1465 length:264 start_codon:yes stop_codon:yes gene_type:complete